MKWHKKLRSKTVSSCLMLLCFTQIVFGQDVTVQDIQIIPKPQSVILKDGNFEIKNNTNILVADPSLGQLAQLLQAKFAKINDALDLKTVISAGLEVIDIPNNHIYLQIDPSINNEAYVLAVTPDYIICKASSSAGMFYGIETLLQIVKNDKGQCYVPSLIIEDAPLYEWRGMMLDESRHFFGKEEVKKHLDVMAYLKMNRFHWHLTDQQGWRVEIKKYPRLTEIGAIGTWSDSKAPSQFYTQKDIQEIVDYAQQRNIMIIPEIDILGHASAVSRAYPEMSGGDEGKWEGFTFHPTKETTYEFIDNILTEIAELFPAPYIHIGGDEVHYGNQSWFTDPMIQQFIKDHDLKDEVGLEHYFVRRVCDIVNGKGKKMIGWDEITKTGVLPQNAVVMWWRHDKPKLLTEALNAGFEVILSPQVPCYFDFVQDDSHKLGRRWNSKFGTLEKVYSFPQNLKSLTKGHGNQILGVQANVWTERIKDKNRLDFMIYPRLLGISEDGWTNGDSKNFADFRKRVQNFLIFLDTYKINYFNPYNKTSTPEPWGPDKEDKIVNG